ncbi:amidohydrolase family protein [Leucobacter sp. NPDC015123]|uniref:amidohydrolase family protein n=1 Tax=Leucobacter sp. NPDC015123 TaxID=3364129 RepID=UPI0036F48B09
MDLVLTQVRPWGGAPVDIEISGDTITGVVESSTGSGARIIDGRGLLALPGFVNAHAHIDKSWWGKPWVPYGGEAGTQGRIAHERAERDSLGIPSLDSTVLVLREFLRHGTTRVRTHVDVDLGTGLRGIETVQRAVDVLGGAVDVEIVAFPQDGVLRRPGVRDLLDQAAANGVAHIGGLDPAAIDRDPAGQLDELFRIAADRDCGIDIHLHDGGSLGWFEYELIIDRTREFSREGRVNVSHGFALGTLPADRVEQTVTELAGAGITWSTVAPVGSAPLPLAQMRAENLRFGLGTDGIRDLWSPYGDGDMLRIAQTFARLHGLRSDAELKYAVEVASSRAGGFVGAVTHDISVGARADIVLLDAENPQDALMRSPRRELVVAGGVVAVEGGEVQI